MESWKSKIFKKSTIGNLGKFRNPRNIRSLGNLGDLRYFGNLTVAIASVMTVALLQQCCLQRNTAPRATSAFDENSRTEK